MADPSVEDAIKQIVLANADNEIRSIATVMISHKGEPEMQLAMAPGTAYSIISGLEILKLHIISKIVSDGAIDPKDRE